MNAQNGAGPRGDARLDRLGAEIHGAGGRVGEHGDVVLADQSLHRAEIADGADDDFIARFETEAGRQGRQRVGTAGGRDAMLGPHGRRKLLFQPRDHPRAREPAVRNVKEVLLDVRAHGSGELGRQRALGPLIGGHGVETRSTRHGYPGSGDCRRFQECSASSVRHFGTSLLYVAI